MEIKNELSKAALENLNRIAQLRKKESKYINIDPEETIILQFDAEKIEQIKRDYDGIISTKYQYTTTESNSSEQKIFETSGRVSRKIDLFLRNGNTVLRIQRFGLGKQTKYNISPC
jgi:hypothetical protein